MSRKKRALRSVDSNTVDLDTYRSSQKHKKTVELIPKTLNQETYVSGLTDPNKLVVFATGPAGTGKTLLAMLAGIKALKEGTVDKLILTRPAVGVDDERHGFLPGDINAKMEPWTRPLFDVLHEHYSPKDTARMLDDQVIEISPLAFMRGRTFKDAWIVADEMQNASPGQMKMLLTRLGTGSKIVVTGDTKQADKKDRDNGLLEFTGLVESYGNSEYVTGVNFIGRDICRHPAVHEILKIYKEI